MAQSAFAAGGGNAKMAQLKKLQANRNMSPAQLRKLVEQIGQRNLRKSPGAFSVAAQPRKGKGGPAPKTEAAKPKPKPEPTTAAKPKPKPQPTTAAKPKPKPQPTTAAKPKPKPQPTAAKPKPKPAPARSSTYSQAAMMKDIRAGEAAAARSKELKKLQELREEAKKKSLAKAKKNRARGQRRGGPRG